MTENNFEDGVTIFKNFQEQSKAGTLTDEHSVMRQVAQSAKVVGYKYNCDSDDLKSMALLSLITESKYDGRGSLKRYIMRVLISKVSLVKAPLMGPTRKPKKVKDSEGERPIVPRDVRLDDNTDEKPAMELIDERSKKLPDKVLLHLAYDTEVRAKIEALPELPRAIFAIVEEHEELLGRRRLAAEATKRLGRKVTPHKVNIALGQLAVIIGASLWWV